MNDRAALLKSVKENPDDDTTRLVYADCVEEEGDELVAEIVRLHVEFAKLPRWEGPTWGGVRGSIWKPGELEKCRLWHSARVKLHSRYKKLAMRSIEGCREAIRFQVNSDGTEFRVTVMDSELEGDYRDTDRFVIASYVLSRGLCSHLVCRWEYWRELSEKIIKSHPISEVSITTPVAFEEHETGAVLVGLPPYKAGTTQGVRYYPREEPRPSNVGKWLCESQWPGIKFNVVGLSRPIGTWRGRTVLYGAVPPSQQNWFMTGIGVPEDFGLPEQENL